MDNLFGVLKTGPVTNWPLYIIGHIIGYGIFILVGYLVIIAITQNTFIKK